MCHISVVVYCVSFLAAVYFKDEQIGVGLGGT